MIIAAIILLLIGVLSLFLSKKAPEENKLTVLGVGVLLTFVGTFSIIYSCIQKVGTGEIGVPIIYGQVQDELLYGGLNIINPFSNVVTINTKLQEYTMTSTKEDGKDDDAITTLSYDGLTIKMELTVWYKIIPEKAPMILQNIGENYEELVVRPAVRSTLRDMAVGYQAVEIYSTKRDEFISKVSNALDLLFKDKGIVLEQVLLMDVELPERVRQAIDEKIASEQHAQQMVYVLQKETQEAERKRIEAVGIKDFQSIVSHGISEPLLKWKAIEVMEKLIYSQNTKVVLLGDKSGIPMIYNNGF